jgi:hypothetical protein
MSSNTELIARLVSDRKAAVDTAIAAPTPAAAPVAQPVDVWAKLATETVYIVRASISRRAKLDLAYAEDDIKQEDPAAAEALRGKRGNGYKEVVSTIFLDRINELQAQQKTAYKDFAVTVGRNHLVTEDRLAGFLDAVKAMEAAAAQANQELGSQYVSEFEHFLQRAADFLNTQIPDTVPQKAAIIEQKLERFSREYPTWEELSQAIAVESSLEKLPSLKANLEANAQAMAQIKAAEMEGAQAELELQKLKAQRAALELQAQATAELLEEARDRSTTDAYTTIGDFLARVTARGGDLTTRDLSALSLEFNRSLSKAVEFVPEIQGLVDAAQELQTVIGKADPEKTEAAMAKFINVIGAHLGEAKLRHSSLGSEGWNNLQKALRLSNELTALETKLAQSIEQPGLYDIAELERDYKALQDIQVVKSRKLAAKLKAARAQAEAHQATQAEAYTAGDAAFDATAGF